jgi:hypothetical protein
MVGSRAAGVPFSRHVGSRRRPERGRRRGVSATARSPVSPDETSSVTVFLFHMFLVFSHPHEYASTITKEGGSLLINIQNFTGISQNHAQFAQAFLLLYSI